MSAVEEMAAELARKAIEAMRGGPLLAVSPQRSEAILAAAFAQVIRASQESVSEARVAERVACSEIARNTRSPIGSRIADAIAARGAL